MNSTTRSVERTVMEVRDDDIQKLLRLTEENNAMLKEILAYVRKVQGKDYLSDDYSREIAFNVIGDIIADGLNPEVINIVKKQFGMK